MHSKLMKSRFSLGTKIYYRSRYGFGIAAGYVAGLHDDFVRVRPGKWEENHYEIVSVRFEDVLSIYDK